MAKYTIRYPSGIKVKKYGLTNAGPSEETTGKVFQTPGKVRFYFSKVPKRGFSVRKSNVTRHSDDVRAINAQLEAVRNTEKAPAVKCAGKPWGEFMKCMKAEMSDLIKPVAEDRGEIKALDWLKI